MFELGLLDQLLMSAWIKRGPTKDDFSSFKEFKRTRRGRQLMKWFQFCTWIKIPDTF